MKPGVLRLEESAGDGAGAERGVWLVRQHIFVTVIIFDQNSHSFLIQTIINDIIILRTRFSLLTDTSRIRLNV